MTLRHVSRRATVLTSWPRRSEGQSVFHSLHILSMRLVNCLSRCDFVVTMMGASLSALHIHLFDGAGHWFPTASTAWTNSAATSIKRALTVVLFLRRFIDSLFHLARYCAR